MSILLLDRGWQRFTADTTKRLWPIDSGFEFRLVGEDYTRVVGPTDSEQILMGMVYELRAVQKTSRVAVVEATNSFDLILEDAIAVWEELAQEWTDLVQEKVELAQAWAEGTLPGGAGTKSAKEWAEAAEFYANLVTGDAAVTFTGGHNDPLTLPVPASRVMVFANTVFVPSTNHSMSEDGYQVIPADGYYWPSPSGTGPNLEVFIRTAATNEDVQAIAAAVAAVQPHPTRSDWEGATIPINMSLSSYMDGLVEVRLIRDDGGDDIQSNGQRWSQIHTSDKLIGSDVQVTVGDGGDYETINDAIRELNRNRLSYQSGGTQVEILLLSGFTMAEQVIVRGENLGWISIVSEDAIVPIDATAITLAVKALDDVIPAFGAMGDGAMLPRIAALFSYGDNTTAKDGVACYGHSVVEIAPECGVQKCRRGIQLYNGGRAVCSIDGLRSSSGEDTTQRGVDFSECLGRALDVQQGSSCTLPRSNFSYSEGDVAVYVIWQSSANLYQSDISHASGTAVNCRDASFVGIRDCNLSDAGGYAIHALHGGWVDARTHAELTEWVGDSAKRAGGNMAVLASHGSHIEAEGLIVDDSAGRGFSAGDASTINAANTSALRCNIGYVAENGSTINARAGVAGAESGDSTPDFGVLSTSGSSINFVDGVADYCERSAEVRDGASIDARNASLRYSTSRTVSAIDGGAINVMGADLSGYAVFCITVRSGAIVHAKGQSVPIDLRDGGGTVHNDGGSGSIIVSGDGAQGVVYRDGCLITKEISGDAVTQGEDDDTENRLVRVQDADLRYAKSIAIPAPFAPHQFASDGSAPVTHKLTRVGTSPNNVIQSIAVDDANGYLYTHHVSTTFDPPNEATIINRYRLSHGAGETALIALDSSVADIRLGHQGLSVQYMDDGSTALWTSAPYAPGSGAKAVRFAYKPSGDGAIDSPEEFTLFPADSSETSSTPAVSRDGKLLIVKRQRTVESVDGFDFRVFALAEIAGAGDYSNSSALKFEWWAPATPDTELQAIASDGSTIVVLEGGTESSDTSYLTTYTVGSPNGTKSAIEVGKGDSAATGDGLMHEPEGLAYARYRGEDVLFMSVASGSIGARVCRVYALGGSPQFALNGSASLGTVLRSGTDNTLVDRGLLSASCNDIFLPGLYRAVDGAAAAAYDAPGTHASGGILTVFRTGSPADYGNPEYPSDGIQIYTQRTSGGIPRQWWRRANGGTSSAVWESTWVEVLTTGRMVGTVSQSGGIPTGAAMQGNAGASTPSGGYYERLADGFQRLHHVVTSDSGGDTTLTFTEPFLTGSTPVVSIMPAGDADYRPRLVSISPTALVFSIRDSGGSRVAVSTHINVSGRWSDMT